jgi:hypothetical protein
MANKYGDGLDLLKQQAKRTRKGVVPNHTTRQPRSYRGKPGRFFNEAEHRFMAAEERIVAQS